LDNVSHDLPGAISSLLGARKKAPCFLYHGKVMSDRLPYTPPPNPEAPAGHLDVLGVYGKGQIFGAEISDLCIYYDERG